MTEHAPSPARRAHRLFARARLVALPLTLPLTLVLALSGCASDPLSAGLDDPSGLDLLAGVETRGDLPSLNADIIARTNAYRAQEGAPRLRRNAELQAAAQAFAARYAANPGERAAWGHEFGGDTPLERATAAGYAGRCLAENLGWRAVRGPIERMHPIDEKMVTGWIESAGHRRNLVNSRYDEIGVGSASYQYNGMRWVVAVQLFGCSS